MKHEALMCKIYERFLQREKLPSMSADELAMEWKLVNERQRRWLYRFCNIWDHNSPYYDADGEHYRVYSERKEPWNETN